MELNNKLPQPGVPVYTIKSAHVQTVLLPGDTQQPPALTPKRERLTHAYHQHIDSHKVLSTRATLQLLC